MAGARQIVDPPTFTPIPYGLLSVVESPQPDGPHWQNGIEYQPLCSNASTTYDECIAVTGAGAAPPPLPFTPNVDMTIRGATPFTTTAEFQCAPVGISDAAKKASDALGRNEAWQVERAFWTGLSGGQKIVYPHLAANTDLWDTPINGQPQTVKLQTAATVVTGAGDQLVSVVEALGLLEGALADCYGAVGVIHVPQVLAPSLDAWGLIRSQGAQMRTINGNKVAIGAGYPGSSPAGAARDADKCWMYATGSIMAYRSEIKVRPTQTQAFNKLENTITYNAERTWLLGWGCCHFAIEAALGVPKGN